MYRRITISLLIIMVSSMLLYADKPLERQANELGVEAAEFYNQGRFLEAGNSFIQAIETMEQAVEEDGIPRDDAKITNWYNFAFQSYARAGEYEKATEALDELQQIDPNNWEYFNNQAIIYRRYLNDIDSAIETIKSYNERNRSFRAEERIASLYLEIEDLQNALLWYRNAYELRQDSRVIRNIATLERRLGDNEAAIQAYQDFIQTEPRQEDLIRTYRNLGALYDELERESDAIESYEMAQSMSYDSDIALLLLDRYFERENYDKAMEQITQILTNDPGNEDAIYFRAMIRYNQGALRQSREDFERLTGSRKYGDIARGYIESIDSEL